MNKKIRVKQHIYFGISATAIIFLFFSDINALFNLAYNPMTPSYLGGKTTFCVIYLLVCITLYVSSLVRKKIPIYLALSITIIFEIINYLSPVFTNSHAASYLKSLFSANGNLIITIKALIILLTIFLSIIIFELKIKWLKVILKIFAILLPLLFLTLEFIIISNINISDIVNFSDKMAASIIFDFLRFIPISAFAFLPNDTLVKQPEN
ncbi:MAG: hypothetical protein KHW62_03160 [Clostridiales bacterium]|nr:hypothetical protein [Clostridiales bacterium]